MVSGSARFAWFTALTGSCLYVVSAIRCASCSVIAMGRSSQGCVSGVGICDVLDWHQWVLVSLLLFECLFSQSLLEKVEEFAGAVMLPGHPSESQAGNGSPTLLIASSRFWSPRPSGKRASAPGIS